MVENYSRVELLTDRYKANGVDAGAIGYVIEVYPDAYEVEFSDPNGNTRAQLVVQPDELRIFEDGSELEHSTRQPDVRLRAS